jgi:hypothetical protein
MDVEASRKRQRDMAVVGIEYAHIRRTEDVSINPHVYLAPLYATDPLLYSRPLYIKPVPIKRIRRKGPVIWCETRWGQWLADPTLNVCDSWLWKEFRRKFRMPPALFLEHFVPEAKRLNLFDAKYKSHIPLEIKLMVGLRTLGRAAVMDDMAEMSGVSVTACYTIFKDFCYGMANKFYPDYVKPPSGDYLLKVMDQYARLGFPGAVGSVDCTHVFWDKCPYDKFHMCKGKEGFTSLAFEAVVDHSRRIHSCTQAFWGATPDTVIVNDDAYVQSIRDGHFADVPYSLYDEDGNFTTFRGGWLIADNGYCDTWAFQKPLKANYSSDTMYWSEFMESVRKDVERTFGILKKRFAFLKIRNQYHDGMLIQEAMHSCCALHNMLLTFDESYNNVNWDVIDRAGEGDEEAIERERTGDIYEEVHEEIEISQPGSGLGIVPPTRGAAEIRYVSRHHQILLKALIAHFKFSFERDSVVWSSGFSVSQRLNFPMKKKGKSNIHNCLYRAPASIVGADPLTGLYTQDVGMGLYSTRAYRKGEKIAMFIGREFKTTAEYAEYLRDHPDWCGYAIGIPGGAMLDCYHHRHECYASLANSFRFAKYINSGGRPARQNADLCVPNGKTVASLVARCNIPRYTEILWDYGQAYQYRVESAAPVRMNVVNSIVRYGQFPT